VAAASQVYGLLGAADQIVAVYPPGGHGYPKDARERSYQFINRVLKAN
jgi:hypothetical protein